MAWVLARRPTVLPPGTSWVSKITRCGRRDWVEVTRTIGPAPTRPGETWTKRSWTAAVSVTGEGGRGTFARGLPPPQPARAAVPARASRRRRTVRPEASATRVAIRPVRGGCWRVHAHLAPRLRGVPGRRHRDERPAGRPLRAHRGRRRAGRRGRAARRVVRAGRRGGAARPRHPALHGHFAGDGGRRAAAGGRPAARRRAAARARAGGPQRGVRHARAAPGVRAGGARMAR